MGQISVNGKTYTGNSVSVENDVVYIDGKRVDDENLPKSILEIKVNGELVSVASDVSVTCENIAGDVQAGGSVNCGDIKGNVTAGGSINADDVGGDVKAGGSVNCDEIRGSVTAGRVSML